MGRIQQALPPDRPGKRVYGPSAGVRVKSGSAITAGEGGVTKPSQEKPFDGMNNIVANMLLNITRSVWLWTAGTVSMVGRRLVVAG